MWWYSNRRAGSRGAESTVAPDRSRILAFVVYYLPSGPGR
jgi:hypothetical protein